MDFQEILDIIKAFFDAITKIFSSLGIFGSEDKNEETTD